MDVEVTEDIFSKNPRKKVQTQRSGSYNKIFRLLTLNCIV